MSELIYKEECDRIIRACFEVYRDKSSYFPESICEECLAIEIDLQEMPSSQEKKLRMESKRHPLVQLFKADFIGFDSIIIELNATRRLADQNRSQVLNYLNAKNHRLGLFVHFFGHHPKIEWEPIARCLNT